VVLFVFAKISLPSISICSPVKLPILNGALFTAVPPTSVVAVITTLLLNKLFPFTSKLYPEVIEVLLIANAVSLI